MPDPKTGAADLSRTDAHLLSGDSAATASHAAAAFPSSSDGGVPGFGPPAEPGEVGKLGPYRVVKELGKGGMGAVYLALDTRLNRKLALKVMLPKFAANRVAKERFLREARAAAQVAHDNVVPVFEADERDGVPYIAMPFLQGYPLDDYLRRKGNLTAQQVIRVGRETAAGLAAAHALGLIHRDIKPANLWLEAPGGRVKILDFGLAKPADSEGEVTKVGAVVGTPAFMSPEQAAGEHLDARSDLFSLGAVLYRLAAGRNPFAGPNVMAILNALATRDPAPVRSLTPDVPAALAALIHRLLAKNPADRPQTATEVAAAFDQLARGLAAGDLSAGDPVPVATAVPEVVYVPIEVTVGADASVFAALESDDSRTRMVRPAAPAKPGGVGAWVAAGLAVAAVALGGVFVVIRNKDGTETKIEVPDGATVEVRKNNKTVASVKADGPPAKKGGPPPAPDAVAIPPDAPPWVAAPWSVLTPAEAKSQGGATLAVQPDGSVLAGGTMAPQDVYTVTFGGVPPSTRALRLEVLTDDALPGKGPGRAAGGRFVLTTLRAALVPPGKPPRPRELKLAEAWADSTTGADSVVPFAVDADDQTGWVSVPGASHVAAFRLPEPAAAPDGTALRVTLEFKHHTGQVLGRFRLSAADPERAAAEYVFARGGFAKLAGGAGAVKAPGDLPAGVVRLAEVSLWQRPVTYEGLAVFAGCESLTALDLSHSGVTDAGLGHFRHTKTLTDLNLGATPVSAAGLAHFGRNANLARLSIYSAEVGDAGLAALKDCTRLADANLHKTGVTDAGLVHLTGMTDLTRLDLTGTGVTDAGVAGLAKALPRCRIVWAGGTIEPRVKTSADQAAAEYVLSVGGKVRAAADGRTREVAAAGEWPGGAARLTYAGLMYNTKVTNAGLAVFKDCKDVAGVDLAGCRQITDAGVAHLKGCTNLKYLNLAGTRVTNAGLATAASAFRSLDFLVLDGTSVTDEGLAHFKGCTTLTWLQLANLSGVTDAGLAVFKDCKNLKRLRLGGTPITDAGLAPLAGMDQLTELVLTKTRVTAGGVEGLAKALPKCKVTWDDAPDPKGK